jgi:glycolate oxidase FAD binding subunit
MSLPLTHTLTPDNERGVADVLRSAREERTPVYPLGGGTSLDYGFPAIRPGIGLELRALQGVIDYPARDMTITVEAGVTLAALAARLAQEGQEVPFDVPCPEQATVGGVVATGWNGPRRASCGGVRDYVIGIRAVDGTGLAFQGGGRVVKNVAGYDFCKLLTGSCGTLAVITQVTFKVRPLAEESITLVLPLASAVAAEAWLDRVATSDLTPTAVILAGGPAWDQRFSTHLPTAWSYGVLRLSGSEREVRWLRERYAELLATGTFSPVVETTADLAAWRHLVAWPPRSANSFQVQAHVLPSQLVPLLELFRQHDGQLSFVSYVAEGVLRVEWSEEVSSLVPRWLVNVLQPAAAAAQGGNMMVLAHPPGVELTRQAFWGPPPNDLPLRQSVKAQFDPVGILNPGRFVV